MSREKPSYENSEAFAALMDERDPLRSYRNLFHIPKTKTGEEFIYFSGNSLGLQPRKAREYVDQELMDWAELGVEGHLHARHPWLPYHEFLNEPTARLVGAKPIEVVVMNTLTVNLHLMMVSFYRPKANRIKILIEKGAFPSDQYAVASQAQFHGYNPKDVILEISPREGESTLRTEDIVEAIKRDGKTIALVLLGQVNYLTGQAFELAPIAQAAYDQGALIGVDLAHGAGNLELQLHDWKIDFAVWCSYKYLNAGPGGLSGCFVHEKHSKDSTLPRFAGWWGHDKKVRFQMGSKFDPMPGAEGWQLSNPPILQLAALRSSMELFDSATIPALRTKSELLTGYLHFLLNLIPNHAFTLLTPTHPKERGCQISLRVRSGAKELVAALQKAGIISDFREPDVIRVAPVPLYNRFSEVYKFAKLLRTHAEKR